MRQPITDLLQDAYGRWLKDEQTTPTEAIYETVKNSEVFTYGNAVFACEIVTSHLAAVRITEHKKDLSRIDIDKAFNRAIKKEVMKDMDEEEQDDPN